MNELIDNLTSNAHHRIVHAQTVSLGKGGDVGSKSGFSLHIPQYEFSPSLRALSTLKGKMPAALPVDHEKVRMVALQIGVREAARQFELPESAVMKWSEREGWFKHKEVADDKLLKVQQQRGVSAAVSKTPSDILAKYSGQSKLHQGKALYKTSKEFSKKTGEELIRQTQALKNTVEASSKLFGWEQSTVNQTLVQVNILDQGSYREVKPNSPVVEQ